MIWQIPKAISVYDCIQIRYIKVLQCQWVLQVATYYTDTYLANRYISHKSVLFTPVCYCAPCLIEIFVIQSSILRKHFCAGYETLYFHFQVGTGNICALTTAHPPPHSPHQHGTSSGMLNKVLVQRWARMRARAFSVRLSGWAGLYSTFCVRK